MKRTTIKGLLCEYNDTEGIKTVKIYLDSNQEQYVLVTEKAIHLEKVLVVTDVYPLKNALDVAQVILDTSIMFLFK